MEFRANILDPIHPTLAPEVWDAPGSPHPHLKPQHRKWIRATVTKVLKDAGYTHIDQWLSLVLTGSLTTYQYGEESDCDVSLFVDAEVFPEWSRAEMIGLMVSHVDGTKLPGTRFPMQCFVVAPGVTKESLYQPGLRSGYDLDHDKWIEPPDPHRSHNVEQEMNAFYVYALEQADKMERLLRYEPDKAKILWHQIHQKRQRDQRAGKGDYAESNIVYKFLANRGLFPEIAKATGEYIAATSAWRSPPEVGYHVAPAHAEAIISGNGLTHNVPIGQTYNGVQVGGNHVYVHDNLTSAQHYADSFAREFDQPYHIWQVDARGLPLEEDPYGTGWRTPSGQGVPPGRVTRIEQRNPSPLESDSWFESKATGEYIARTARGQDRIVTKFVYDPATNHLVLGRTGREEGENESHNQLLQVAGIDPANAVFGQFDTKGRVETFGRPLIRGFGQQDISHYESDYRLKQALEQAIPGISHSAFEPPHSDWENEDAPKVTYLGDPPTITPDYAHAGPPEEGAWDF